MAAQAPLAVPAARSISPSSRTKTRPIAMNTVMPAWLTRLARLKTVRKRLLAWEKMTARTMRPSTAGSAPTSPPRTRLM